MPRICTSNVERTLELEPSHPSYAPSTSIFVAMAGGPGKILVGVAALFAHPPTVLQRAVAAVPPPSRRVKICR